MIEGADEDAATPRRAVKSESAFRTISEVSEELDVPQHVLRFWEGKFSAIRPLKRGGGRRYYRPEDVVLLRRIRDLLYKDGYTIRGAQKLLKEQSRGGPKEPVNPEGPVREAEIDSDAAPDNVIEIGPEAEPEPEPGITPETMREVIDAEPDFAPYAEPEAAMEPGDTTVREELTSILGELEDLRSLLATALKP